MTPFSPKITVEPQGDGYATVTVTGCLGDVLYRDEHLFDPWGQTRLLRNDAAWIAERAGVRPIDAMNAFKRAYVRASKRDRGAA